MLLLDLAEVFTHFAHLRDLHLSFVSIRQMLAERVERVFNQSVLDALILPMLRVAEEVGGDFLGLSDSAIFQLEKFGSIVTVFVCLSTPN